MLTEVSEKKHASHPEKLVLDTGVKNETKYNLKAIHMLTTFG